ncbi:TetR/AcrR family transcriptional regulator C-terminal domain-containing protein [Streptomyces sp. NPDC000983]|uniref:TetR/AcrR family transcriptional regulator C-terminal domain-containing protein n=1 Tax=Streptomyces sp. NPDC000983 TaxID=3154373 RepID=UPI003327F9DE
MTSRLPASARHPGGDRRLTDQGLLRIDDPLLAANHFSGLLLWIPANKAMFAGRAQHNGLDRHAAADVRVSSPPAADHRTIRASPTRALPPGATTDRRLAAHRAAASPTCRNDTGRARPYRDRGAEHHVDAPSQQPASVRRVFSTP